MLKNWNKKFEINFLAEIRLNFTILLKVFAENPLIGLTEFGMKHRHGKT